MATSRDFFSVNGVRAASFIEAVWRFADYLSGRSWLDEEEERRVREMCQAFFDHYVEFRGLHGPRAEVDAGIAESDVSVGEG